MGGVKRSKSKSLIMMKKGEGESSHLVCRTVFVSSDNSTGLGLASLMNIYIHSYDNPDNLDNPNRFS